MGKESGELTWCGVEVKVTTSHQRGPMFESCHGHGCLCSSWSQKTGVKIEGELLYWHATPKNLECTCKITVWQLSWEVKALSGLSSQGEWINNNNNKMKLKKILELILLHKLPINCWRRKIKPDKICLVESIFNS